MAISSRPIRRFRSWPVAVLGIETSCDETAAAVVRGGKILSSVVSSQVERHRPFRGVVPELASRAHQEKITEVLESAVADAFPGTTLGGAGRRLDAVAFTRGPGLAGALLVGKAAATALSVAWGLPLIGVNHLEAHALAHEFIRPLPFPFLSLIVSGGHTDLVLVKGRGRYRVLGRTRDDAAGEAFDKVAKLLDLEYPGGPAIDRLARQGKADAVRFPRPILPGTWDFSFSGLKTAVLYHVRDRPGAGAADVCAAFQEALVDALVAKVLNAAEHFQVPRVAVGGGVAANSRLRESLTGRGKAKGVDVVFTPLPLCGDNAAMIAYVGALRLAGKKFSGARLAVDPELPIKNW